MSDNEGPTVLVVDDYATMRRIMKNQLGQIGFSNVVEAADGEEAWQVLQSQHIDLVVSDWNMKPVTGYELLRRMRAEAETKNTPFIMVTAEARPQNVVAAKKAGVSQYIIKPFTAETLKAKIASISTPQGRELVA